MDESMLGEDFIENMLGKEIQRQHYLPKIGLSPVPQTQLCAIASIQCSRRIFERDAADLQRVLELVEHIEGADIWETPETSDKKIKLLGYLWGRAHMKQLFSNIGLDVPSIGEQFCAVRYHVVVLIPACTVVIASVPTAIRQTVIKGIAEYILDLKTISIEARNLFKTCAEADSIITLTPYESYQAVLNAHTVALELKNSLRTDILSQ